jgi:hypothetical protein
MLKVPEEYRVKSGQLASTAEIGNNGCFLVPFESYTFTVIVSDGMDFDHVSVSLNNRTPNWKEMCFIKELFFGKDDCVVQYHPSEGEYVNNHEHCLHLWKSQKVDMPVPPSILVGIK